MILLDNNQLIIANIFQTMRHGSEINEDLLAEIQADDRLTGPAGDDDAAGAPNDLPSETFFSFVRYLF